MARGPICEGHPHLKGLMMMRKTILAAALAALAASSAMAAVEKVSGVEVTADLSAVQNEKAAAYWANLTDDLTNAIAARLVDRIDPEGPAITVDIEEVALANAFERAFNLADAALTGEVQIKGPQTNATDQRYQLKVSLEGVTPVAADGTAIVFSSMDTPVTYETLINTFADAVVNSLDR